jgi:DNA-binding beta-propeller fold protein YncE
LARRRAGRLALALTVALTAGAATASPTPAAFTYIRSFGSGNGMQSGPGQLSTPHGAGFSPKSGHLYVADTNNDRVQEFRANGSFLRLFGGSGSANGKFASPAGLGVNRAGQTYVADGGNLRVQEFSPTHTFIRAFGSFTNSPSDLAVGPGGDVYVADGGFIRHFTAAGAPIGSFGGTGSGDGQFNSTISGLGAGPNGHVFAGDYSGARVEEFTGAGTFVRSLANSGQAAVMGPIGVGVARNGHIFVSDNGHERVIELLANGSFVRAFGNSGPGKLDNPGSLSVDCAGNVYVSDIDAGRVREYGNPKAPLPPCRPAVSNFRIKPKTVQSGHRTTFKYSLNEAGRVKISIDGVGSLQQVDAHAGSNKQSFKKVKGKALKPGGYRATIVAKAFGLKSKPRHVKFTVE